MMDSNNLYGDFVDDIANYEFQKLFYGKFENSNVTFLPHSLKDCFKKLLEEKKPLIFFLHDDNDEYSRRCIELLNEECVEELISEHFLILGWRLDVSENFIKYLARRIIITEDAGEYIENKQPCIFTIIPNMNTVEIYEKLEITKENINKENWLFNQLMKVKKIMSLRIKEEDFSNMTSIKYQQRMCDELGDRDYDSFEKDEHAKLKEKLLYAMFGPPKSLDGYEEKQKKEVELIYNTIRSKNNEYSKWNDRIVISFIYNCLEPLAEEKQKKASSNKDYKSEQDFYPAPVFVIRKCKFQKKDREHMNRRPCRIFIDSARRVYANWEKYLKNNVLPPGKMVYPAAGKYKANKQDEVELETANTPSSTTGTAVLKATDIGTSVVGLLSGAAIIASTFTPLGAVTVPCAIFAGITTGVYAAGRGTAALVDRSQHEQSVNITDSESRGAYLSIGTAALGIAGAGATTALASFTRTGANIGRSVRYTVDIINGANILMAGTATANGFYDVYQQWREEDQAPSSLVLLQLGSSLFFFGNSVVNFRTAGSLIKEVQTSTLNEIDQALRSNRQRKTFNKLLKETTRLKGNTKGNAEVISTMRNPATRDEILGVLTRSNKNLNKIGVRFSAEGGGIALNGVPVDILEFGNIPKSDHSMYFEAFPSIPESHQTFAKQNDIKSYVENMQLNENARRVFTAGDSTNAMSLVTNILNYFKEEAQREIIKICENFMNLVDINCVERLRKFLSGDIKGHIIRYVACFIKKCATDMKTIFERRLLNEDVNTVREEFGLQNPQINDFIDFVVNKFTVNNDMMDRLLADFVTWTASLIYDSEKTTERKEKRHAEQKMKNKQDCLICGGYYYEQK